MDSSKVTDNKEFTSALYAVLKQKADRLMKMFIEEGPHALRKKLRITVDKHWQYVFDYLVFSEEVLKKCVVQYMPYFKNLVSEQGPLALRTVFEITDEKYDEVYEKLFDIIAISHGALYDHVYRKKEEYVRKIMSGEAKDIRKSLCPDIAKYDALWGELLEILQSAVCTNVYPEHTFEQGIRIFTSMMNTLRVHRSLRSFKAMWAFSSGEEKE